MNFDSITFTYDVIKWFCYKDRITLMTQIFDKTSISARVDG